MTQEAEIKEVMEYEKFREPLGGWAEPMKPYIESKGMWDLYQKLKADRQKGQIVPKYTETFRAFKSCPPGEVKVIFYLQDPYPRLYKDGTPQASGIAMDCRNSPDGKIQPSLEYWYDGIDRYMGSKEYKSLEGYKRLDNPPKCERTGNLDYLHEQGVMLLNTDLTCKVNKTSSHKGYWRGFQKYLLETVMFGTTGIIYVLCGNDSHTLEEFINPLGNYVFKIEHPFAAGHRGDEVWRDENIFAKINKILVENNGEPFRVWWDKKDWDFYKSPPF